MNTIKTATLTATQLCSQLRFFYRSYAQLRFFYRSCAQLRRNFSQLRVTVRSQLRRSCGAFWPQYKTWEALEHLRESCGQIKQLMRWTHANYMNYYSWNNYLELNTRTFSALDNMMILFSGIAKHNWLLISMIYLFCVIQFSLFEYLFYTINRLILKMR